MCYDTQHKSGIVYYNFNDNECKKKFILTKATGCLVNSVGNTKANIKID